MSTQHQQTLKTIKGMKSGLERESLVTRTQGQDSSVVGASGVLVERIRKRRNNINALPGLIREHAALILQIRNGEIALDRGEVLSRAYSRHREMVGALEQRTQLAAIEEQLKALRGNPSQQMLIDESQRKDTNT